MQCCLAFYDNLGRLNRAYGDYWKKRRATNLRFLGLLLFLPPAEDVRWRSAKCPNFRTPQGYVNFIAFGVDASKPRNHCHGTGPHPLPDRLVIVNLTVTAALERLGVVGLNGLMEVQVDTEKLELVSGRQ